MNPDIAQGVAYEIDASLLPGWQMKQLGDKFVIVPASSDVGRLREEVWRLARLVAYDSFVSISKQQSGGYEIASRMASGSGFVIQVEPN